MFNKNEILEQSKFKDPHPRYRPMPFWFWNSKLTEEEINRQITMMHDAGLGGFFIHARFGLETEYMSDEWMSCVRTAVEAADRLSMYAWLYDEYPFPSGIGGLKVTQNPNYRNKYIDLVERQVSSGQSVDICLPSSDVLAAAALPVLDGKIKVDSLVDLRGFVNNGEVRWTAPEGDDWIVAICAKCVLTDSNGNVFGPDYLSKDATDTFIELIHSKYAQAVGEYFGSVIPGIFTDEPCLLAWHQGHTCFRVHHDARLAVWSEDLEISLLQKLSTDLQRIVLSIFYDAYSDSHLLRREYRRDVADLYCRNFFAPYREWCEDNNLLLTGHLLLEEGLYSNTIFQGDFINSLGMLHIPGSDHLTKAIDGEYRVPNVPVSKTRRHGQKIVSSTAHKNNSGRVISEVFGCSGWTLNFQEMKRIVDWLYVQGINFLCPHAFFYSLEGFRKSDAPPSQSYHSPWWKYYRGFSDYVGRLSYMLSGGTHRADIAVFYPSSSFYSSFKPGVQEKRDILTSETYDFYCDRLSVNGYDYDIVSEDCITLENISAGKLLIGNESFSVLVLPAVWYMKDEVMEALKCFVESGGRLIATLMFPGLPIWEEDLVISQDQKALEDLFDAKSIATWKQSMQTTEQVHVSKKQYGLGTAYFLNCPEAMNAHVQDTLWHVLEDALLPVLSFELEQKVELRNEEGKRPREIECLQIVKDGREVYFLVNHSQEQIKANISIPGAKSLEVWNPETGEISLAEVVGSILDWTFEPCQSLFLVNTTHSSVKAHSNGECTFEKTAVLSRALSEEWEFERSLPNVHILDNWVFSAKATDSGYVYTYSVSVEMEQVPPDMRLLFDDIEKRDSYMESFELVITVNGTARVIRDFDGTFMEDKFKYVDIAQVLRPGSNTIEIKFVNNSWGEEPKLLTELPKLLGSFALQKSAQSGTYRVVSEPDVIRTGSWTTQGYPYYSGEMEYRQIAQVSRDELHARVNLFVKNARDVVRVVVNDHDVGTRLWAPYEFEIDEYLREGQNRISLQTKLHTRWTFTLYQRKLYRLNVAK
jgi:hypothetical protein